MISNFNIVKEDVKQIKQNQDIVLNNMGIEPFKWEKSVLASKLLFKRNTTILNTPTPSKSKAYFTFKKKTIPEEENEEKIFMDIEEILHSGKKLI